MKKTLLLLFVALSGLTFYNASYAQNAVDIQGNWSGYITSSQSISINLKPDYTCDILINGVAIPFEIVKYKTTDITEKSTEDTPSEKVRYSIKFYTKDAINGVKCKEGESAMSLSEGKEKSYKGTAVFYTKDLNTMILDIDFLNSPCAEKAEKESLLILKKQK